MARQLQGTYSRQQKQTQLQKKLTLPNFRTKLILFMSFDESRKNPEKLIRVLDHDEHDVQRFEESV